MTAMPVARLHERLDAAFALHPESNTLADFRADEWLARAESEALQTARRIITPHSEIAALYKDKALLLDWSMPAVKSQAKRAGTRTLAFPASTLGRKGAYELRAAVQGLDVKVVTFGAQLEGTDFWRGTAVEIRTNGKDWLEGVDVVVLPAFVEHKPRRLLEAVARGTPVIASTACGLEHVKGVTSVAIGDVEALRAAIERAICGGSGIVLPDEKEDKDHVKESLQRGLLLLLNRPASAVEAIPQRRESGAAQEWSMVKKS